MSNARLPPPPGEVVKVVFEGVEPGSAQAQQLLREYQGPITHFHAKARQQRELADSPTQHMQSPLGEGGRMTYSFNNGQETVRVRLEPGKRVPPPPQRIPERPGYVIPTLAIDVLFEADSYVTADVYTSNAPEGWNDPAYWTAERMLEHTYIFYSAERVVAYYRTNALYRHPKCTVIEYGFWQGIVPYAEGNIYAGPYYPYLAQPYGPLIPAPPVIFDGSIAVWTYYMRALIEFDLLEENPPGSNNYVERHVAFEEQIIIGNSAVEQSSGSRETYEYLDVLTPAGIIGGINPDRPDLEYGALALLPPDRETFQLVGDPKRRDDDRLRALGENYSKEADERELLFLDPSHMGFVGSGFIAIPVLDPAVGGSEGQKCVFDIYIATENLNKHNPPPGTADSGGWANDSPDMEYGVGDVFDGPTEIEWKIRAREFASSTPVAVKVRTWTERRMRVFASGPPGGGGGGGEGGGGVLVVTPGGVQDGDGWFVNAEAISGGLPPPSDPPPGPDDPPAPPEQPQEDDRTVTWYFAADKDWEDKGAEPADPENTVPQPNGPPKPVMGELLAELAGSTTPKGPTEAEIEENRAKEVRQQSIWDVDVKPDPDTPEQEIARAIKDKMTKIATLTWYPPAQSWLSGKAEIEAA